MGNEFRERRKHQRLVLHDGIVVKIHRRRLLNLVKLNVVNWVPVLNLSFGGLAFEYKGRKMCDLDGCEMTIRSADDGEQTQGLEFKVISDYIPHNPGTANMENPPGRRCGIQFNNVTPGQSAQIDRMFKRYSRKETNGTRSNKRGNGWYYIDIST